MGYFFWGFAQFIVLRESHARFKFNKVKIEKRTANLEISISLYLATTSRIAR
jgi:hypothetical protein